MTDPDRPDGQPSSDAAGSLAGFAAGSLRRSYDAAELSESDLAPTWAEQLQLWYAAAAGHPQIAEPNAMQVATVGAGGDPDVRTVLARRFEGDAIVFYTNYDSAKGQQLAAVGRAALLFSWLPLERQVRLSGTVSRVSREDTEAYFASRPRGSQIAAWASQQSRVIASRAVLTDAVAEWAQRWAGADVPAPPNWGGLRVQVQVCEFWQGRSSRLHDRLRYRRDAAGSAGWVIERLAP